jgi:carboxyl-terminal processing protease
MRARVRKLICVSLLLTAGCGPTDPSPALRQRLVAEIGRVLASDGYATGVEFGRWTELIERHRETLDAASTHAEIAAALNSALEGFGVSHLAVLTPQESAERVAGTRLGAGLTVEPVPGGLLVCAVVEEGPAALAGLRGGDVLSEIGGVPALSAAQLTGKAGESKTVAWAGPGQERQGTLAFQSHRRASPDRLRWLDSESALISVHSFADGLYDRALIDRFFNEAGAASGIVLDLRSNKGGNAANVEHLLGQVTALRTAPFTDIYREDADTWRHAHPGAAPTAAAILAEVAPRGRSLTVPPNATIYQGRLAILIDSQCGSGGELAPEALRQLGRAVIVGTRSRGKVRIGRNVKLAGGYELQVPIGEFVAADGRTIEGTGVVPDVELAAQETARDEVILPRARSALDAAAHLSGGDD